MKFSIRLFTFLLLVLMAAPVSAHFKSNLYLWKLNPYDYGACGFCTQYLNFVENQNRINFSDFQLVNQTGYYYFRLIGHAGSTVTLFGQTDYSTKGGYLVVTKKDNRDISVPDLEAFPPGQWVNVPATDQSGGFSVFYRPFTDFKNNVASLKWGKWWGASLPEN